MFGRNFSAVPEAPPNHAAPAREPKVGTACSAGDGADVLPSSLPIEKYHAEAEFFMERLLAGLEDALDYMNNREYEVELVMGKAGLEALSPPGPALLRPGLDRP